VRRTALKITEMLEIGDGQLPDFADLEGDFPMVYQRRSGAWLCPDCANADVQEGELPRRGWRYLSGPERPCGACGCPLVSAYGDPDQAPIYPLDDRRN
jgi:hypothetical protein